MHRLTREVRFAINTTPDDQLSHPPTNSYAGHPSLTGLGHFFTLSATLAGPLTPTGYLRNIKDIDHQIRSLAIPLFIDLLHPTTTPAEKTSPSSAPLSSFIIHNSAFSPTPSTLLTLLFATLKDAWPGSTLERLKLALSPYLSLETTAKDYPMTRLSQKFEFSASHRLHNPNLSDADNRAAYGKCNNPHGHGHNYELQVTLLGTPDPLTGLLVDIPAFERTVADTIIQKFDHKNLNAELPEFKTLVPSVENIAGVIYQLLKPKLQTDRTHLASVTVWETPKTFCEYTDD